MKIHVLIIALVTCLLGTTLETNCKDFRTGKFKMEDAISGTNFITRNDSTQIEYLPKLGIKVELNAVWTSDCTLELSLKNILENKNNYPISDFVLVSEIIKTTDSSYVMSSEIKGVNDTPMVKEFIRID